MTDVITFDSEQETVATTASGNLGVITFDGEDTVSVLGQGDQVFLTFETGLPGAPGPTGPAGTSGALWYPSAAGPPASGTGIVGDFGLVTSGAGLGDVYQKTAVSTWTLQGNIRGATGGTGSTGAAGTAWFSASTDPASGTGVINDYALNTTSGDVFKKTGTSVWTLQGNIKGPTGATGAGVPTGGTTGQTLVKNSATNYDASWGTVSGLPTGGTTGQALVKNSATNGDASWQTIVTSQLFRGEWAADTSGKVYDFASGSIPAEFVKSHDTNGLGSADPAVATTASAGQTGAPGYTNSAKLLQGNISTSAWSRLSLALSSVPGITGTIVGIQFYISRSASGGSTQVGTRVQKNGLTQYSQQATDGLAWSQQTITATSSDTILFESYGLQGAGGLSTGVATFVTGIDIRVQQSPYMNGQYVMYGGKMYRSTADSNVTTPGASGTWVEVPMDPMTTKGDILVRTATSTVRQAAGANGQILVADSAQTNGVRWGPVPPVVSGLLGKVNYNPGSQATISTVATAMDDVDATNLAVTFVAPQSGEVIVTLTAGYQVPDNSGGYKTLFWGLREGSTTVASRFMRAGDAEVGAPDLTGETSFVITGLTPGSSHTYKWGHFVSAGTGKLYAGGATNGAAIMTVHDATTYAPNTTADCPHAEFTLASFNTNGGTATLPTPVLDATRTTETALPTLAADGVLTFPVGGVYAVSVRYVMSAPPNARTFASIQVPSGTEAARAGMGDNVNEDTFTVVTPGSLITAGQSIKVGFYSANNTPRQVTGRIQVTRMLSAATLPPQPRTINAQTGTTYTLVLTDAGAFVTMTNASASTLTIPPSSSVNFPIGTVIEIAQLGAGQVTVTPGAGVTVNGAPGLKSVGQYSTFGLLKIGTDTWLAYGRLSA